MASHVAGKKNKSQEKRTKLGLKGQRKTLKKQIKYFEGMTTSLLQRRE